MKKIKALILLISILIIFIIYKGNNNHNIRYINISDKIFNYNYNDYLKDKLLLQDKLDYYININKNNLTINDIYNMILLNKNFKTNKGNISIKRALRESIITLSIGNNDIILEESLKDSNKVNKVYKKYKELIKEINKYNSKIYIIETNNKKLNNKIKRYIRKTDNIIIDNNINYKNINIILTNNVDKIKK